MVKVSVLLCSNKIDTYFHEAIKSLLCQDFKNFEIIIVLNGSAASAINDVKQQYKYYKFIKIHHSAFSYLQHSLNLGLELASGKYIARMDADDISYPNRLSTQFKFMESNPSVSVCGSWYQLIDDNGIPFKNVKLPIGDVAIKKALYFRNPMCHPSIMVRREIILKAGGYLGGIFAEDYDLWIRLSRIYGYKFDNIPKYLLGYRSIYSGSARASANAYASSSASQWRLFVLKGNPLFLIGSILSVFKRIFLSKNDL